MSFFCGDVLFYFFKVLKPSVRKYIYEKYMVVLHCLVCLPVANFIARLYRDVSLESFTSVITEGLDVISIFLLFREGSWPSNNIARHYCFSISCKLHICMINRVLI